VNTSADRWEAVTADGLDRRALFRAGPSSLNGADPGVSATPSGPDGKGQAKGQAPGCARRNFVTSPRLFRVRRLRNVCNAW
jgi:hypothetical protein